MKLTAFCDGACSGNPGPGGWAMIISTGAEVIEAGGHRAHTTNNDMELEASCQILEFCFAKGWSGELTLCTDSKYVIQGVTEWRKNWKRRGWKKADGEEVLNLSQWKRLDELADGWDGDIDWVYVPGHSGIPGNERVDEIAVQYSKLETPSLYSGSLEAYTVDLEDVGGDASGPSKPKKKSSGSKSKGGYYLSFVGGKLERHETWDSCQKRVSGVSGAKFKKVSSQSEEAVLLKSWGA